MAGRALHAPGDTVAHDVIVSMTSYPKRLGMAYQAIESLFQQATRPAKVILWLARDQVREEHIPATLRRLQRRGLEIRYVDHDLGSHKKLYYAAKEYPEYIIVTADDDAYYPFSWLQTLYDNHKLIPQYVLCYRGHFLRKHHDGTLVPYQQMANTPVVGLLEPSYGMMATGVSGVLYPTGIFDESFFDIPLYLTHSMNADDIWYKMMTIRQNIKTFRITPANKLCLRVLFSNQSDGISFRAGSDSRNDQVFAAMNSLWPGILDKVEPIESLRYLK